MLACWVRSTDVGTQQLLVNPGQSWLRLAVACKHLTSSRALTLSPTWGLTEDARDRTRHFPHVQNVLYPQNDRLTEALTLCSADFVVCWRQDYPVITDGFYQMALFSLQYILRVPWHTTPSCMCQCGLLQHPPARGKWSNVAWDSEVGGIKVTFPITSRIYVGSYIQEVCTLQHTTFTVVTEMGGTKRCLFPCLGPGLLFQIYLWTLC